MKKTTNFITVFLFTVLLFSCGKKEEAIFKTYELSNGYTISLPEKYSKTSETRWQAGENANLFISMIPIENSDLKTEMDAFLASRNTEDMFDSSELIKSEDFDKNGLKGTISFFKENLKKQGAGIVTLTSYGVYALVRDGNSQFKIISMSLSDNNFELIEKSIKSFSSDTTQSKTPAVVNFDKNKAIEDGYQVFLEDGFMVKCQGEIKLDEVRIQQFKQSGNNNSRPFHVFVNGTDYNINVSSFDIVLSGQSEKEIADYNKNDLDYYQTKFDEMSVKNQRGNFKNYDAVYYENIQDGKTTKAVYFHHGMKGYMIQVTDKNNVEKKFQEFIKNFEII